MRGPGTWGLATVASLGPESNRSGDESLDFGVFLLDFVVGFCTILAFPLRKESRKPILTRQLGDPRLKLTVTPRCLASTAENRSRSKPFHGLSLSFQISWLSWLSEMFGLAPSAFFPSKISRFFFQDISSCSAPLPQVLQQFRREPPVATWRESSRVVPTSGLLPFDQPVMDHWVRNILIHQEWTNGSIQDPFRIHFGTWHTEV